MPNAEKALMPNAEKALMPNAKKRGSPWLPLLTL
tara:strand:+ start:120 stop:221 length:102 start_codon:yes stop_codon:yes gene_type:complete